MLQDLIEDRVLICSFEGKERYADYYLCQGDIDKIFVKFGVPFELDIGCLFEIISSGEFFILKETRSIEEKKTVSSFRAGHTLDVARMFLINKVIAETIPNKFEDPLGEIEDILRGRFV